MDSVVDGCRAKVTGEEQNIASIDNWESVRAKVESYLRAWRLPGEWKEELIAEAILAARSQAITDGNFEATHIAIQEAEKQIAGRLNEALMGDFGAGENCMPIEQRMAMICSAVPVKWPRLDSSELRASYLRGMQEFERAQQPQRPRETRLTTMETSLSRLPSARMIAGWFGLIILIFLVFIFTR